ncbi:MAG: hypothetical protein IPN90_04270 [Elusimicrobia bacterium]|nr:hypothetical protein [Elusimicrobiota bacterium]
MGRELSGINAQISKSGVVGGLDFGVAGSSKGSLVIKFAGMISKDEATQFYGVAGQPGGGAGQPMDPVAVNNAPSIGSGLNTSVGTQIGSYRFNKADGSELTTLKSVELSLGDGQKCWWEPA